MSVHYKFKSALEYDTITFDGLHISVKDLKNAIIQQKRIGRSTDFDLRITNAQTQEVYEDENALIPKNTSLLIARVPVIVPKAKQWEGYGGNDTPPTKLDDGGPIGKAMDLASLDAPEDDKIKAMMSQSTQDYDPSNYIKIRGSNQVGPVPPSYRCYRCHQNGHWIKDCPMSQGVDSAEIKKSTGIPHSFMIPVEGPQVPGAMMMSNGQYAVPALDLQAYNHKSTGPQPVQAPKPEIPEDLLCSICSDLLTDAVMIPCCGNSFCDECIRTVLLESEEHECPDCHEKDISPATLIPNRFLRKSVANFKNTTGYEKKTIPKPKPEVPKEEPKKESTPPPVVDSTEKENSKEEEKTVISEADSTEHAKSDNEFSKDIELDPPKTDDSEGPPGVSPKQSPVHHITSKITGERNDRDRDRRSSKHKRRRGESPRNHRQRRSESYDSRHSEERQGTPTRDEPPGVGNNYAPPVSSYSDPPTANIPPGTVVAPIQGPPPGTTTSGTFPPGLQPPIAGFPPVQGPPPNFRMPPPGSQPPPFMGPGPYHMPPRPVFDPTRPPLGGPPGGFGPGFGGRPRDFGRRGGRDRTPPGLIDDPLAAFNRILREKDEKRARQQRMVRRSWSRSRSRSRSYSRSPPPLRRRSRSPRRRGSRSRSRSFSMSRSRSRSYSKSPRGSPPSTRRSPPPLQARRGAPRFRSPLRSSPPRRRNDRNDFDREFDRGNFRDKPRARRADSRDRFFDDRDRDFDRGQQRPRPPPMQPQQQWGGQRDGGYYPQEQQNYQNRYPAPPMQNIPPQRKFDDNGPPGVQPPIPGLETELPPVDVFQKNKKTPERKDKEKDKIAKSPRPEEKDRKERSRRKDEKRSKSRTPERWRNPSPRPRDLTPDKPRRRRVSSESKDDRKRDKDRHRDYSDEDKKRSKDKKKHKEKKEEKKKRKEKKDKHHKSKDKKDKKEEFKQVIPKIAGESGEDSDTVRKKIEERKKLKEIEESKKHEKDEERKKREEEEEKEKEKKRLAEERKKEERRLRFIEDEKRKREALAKKEEAKRKAIEEARKALEEEERLRLEKERENQKTNDLYDEVIPKKDAEIEIVADFNQPPDHLKEAPVNSPKMKEIEEGEVTDEPEPTLIPKETEEEDSGILELHSDMDIKLDDTDILAPMPEKSKWEVDEDGQMQSSPKDSKDQNDSKTKVSSEVLKRAENVIFARAINSIRPIEIKKISGERAKLYADEKREAEAEPKKIDLTTEKPRLSVKERLGKKVDDPDPRVILIDNPRSVSPFSRRDRRIEIEVHRRQDRRRSSPRRRDHSKDKDKHKSKLDRSVDKNKRNKKDDKEKHDDRKEKRKRSRSRSESEDRKKKRKDKKSKKEKPKKQEDESKKEEVDEQKPKSATEKRKPTLDEASFEPDYDLELHDDEAGSDNEKETKKEKSKKNEESDDDSSSSESSSSSSEEERKKRKRKKQKKKKKKESSSSESESSSESSDSERDRKRKKHRKSKKKKKKSRHK